MGVGRAIAIVVVLVLLVGVAAPAGGAQNGEDTDAQATVSALQTQVTELE